MHTAGSEVASKKRKRSGSSEESSERKRTSSLIRRSIALLTSIPEVPAASLHPLLSTLNEAYGSALSEEALEPQPAPQAVREEDWDWRLSAEQIAELSQEELTIWKDLLVSRDIIEGAGIKVHPSNWRMPVVDLRQWEVHIPGNHGTPWAGGVYSLRMTFSPGSPDCIPRLRFFVPVFHPNVFPSGTWGYFNFPELSSGSGKNRPYQWLKSRQEEPVRFAKLLLSIRDIIHEPVIQDPSQSDAYTMCKNDLIAYDKRVRAQAEAWKPDPRTGFAGRPVLHPIKEEEK
ncbi:ubiquitin-conjugating enzyme/RWD-like protein [Mycena polygramma]|nr:ubiquitin-conjugating enzyme/RWD-like protein [Mycena polygramma]